MEVDLKKPLKGSILINGERHYVSYEGLNTICSVCGVYGHLAASCPRKVAEHTEQVPAHRNVAGNADDGQPEKGFTVVRRSNRRVGKPANTTALNACQFGNVSERNVGEIERINNTGNLAISNSFSGLVEESTEVEDIGGMETMAANKENEMAGITLIDGESENQVKGRFDFGKGNQIQGSDRGAGGEKKSFGPKNGKANGPKLKGPMQSRPGRGLVFGPRGGVKDLIFPGKRLRVETEEAGRPGGVFPTTKTVGTDVRQPLKVLEDQSNGIRSGSDRSGKVSEQNLQGSLMEVGARSGEQ